MKCEKCGTALDSDDTYEYAGRKLCEDCYLEIIATPRVCDPWAVYSAKRMSKDKVILTPLQEQILTLIKEKGPLTAEGICSQLNINENDFRSNFAPLRHMELAKSYKQGNKIYYDLFNK